jgi:hypothetical protein
MSAKLTTGLLLSVFSSSTFANNSWKQQFICKNETEGIFDIEVSNQQFPNVDSQINWKNIKGESKAFHLVGHYAQSFDYSENKKYYGYILYFTNSDSSITTNKLSVWIEDNKNIGYAELVNADLTEVAKTISIPCLIEQE